MLVQTCAYVPYTDPHNFAPDRLGVNFPILSGPRCYPESEPTVEHPIICADVQCPTLEL